MRKATPTLFLLMIVPVFFAGCWQVTGPYSGESYLYSPVMPKTWYRHSHEKRAAKYAKQHPQRPAEFAKAISEGKIRTGMTREEVRLAWGDPYKREPIGDSAGSQEQWIYAHRKAGFWQPWCHVQYKDGLVSSWQK